MYEVEVKVPADLDRVRERLAALGADERGRVVQEDTYYDAPHRSFAETDEALRIREERIADTDRTAGSDRSSEDDRPRERDRRDDGGTGGETRTRLTYKGPLVDPDSKTREEVETAVEDPRSLGAILAHLGFEPAETVRKERERYVLDGYAVTLDAVDDVGEFVEVETDADEAGVDAAREGAYDVLRRLGLDPDDQVRTSYLGLKLGADPAE